jgi:hypothetical protein
MGTAGRLAANLAAPGEGLKQDLNRGGSMGFMLYG